MLRVQLFGSGHVFEGATEIALPSRNSTLPLLAYVALRRAETIPRARLAFTIWPDETEEVALHNLRRKLHVLQSALTSGGGEPLLVADADGVAWNGGAACMLDIAEFERLRGTPETLEQAVAFYDGDLLEDVYDDWIAADRERLRGLFVSDLSALIVAARSRREYDAAIRHAQRLLRTDPFREDALRHLMSARYEAGDAAGALAEFRRFSDLLRGEMSADPMPETVALRDAVARGAAIPSAPRRERAEKRAPTDAPFVGRESELERLREQWARAADGTGILVFVRGTAGIGKSRLAGEIALQAEADGGRVILGTTSSPERAPYQCLASAVRAALPLVANIAMPLQLVSAIAEIVPELRAHRSDVPPLTRLDPDSERGRLFDAFAQLFGALARPRPLLLILEDVHNAGAATIEGLRVLTPLLARSAILVIATYRDDDPTRSLGLAALERASPVLGDSITVGPLSGRDVEQLARAFAPRGSASPAFLSSLARQSAGNPLFVTELLRDAKRMGADVGSIPESVSSMLRERLESVTVESRSIAEIAAVAGEAFTLDVVREIAGLPEGTLLDSLDELLDRHLVRESIEPRYEYAFTHHLVHAVIYEGSPPDVRARRHRRMARWLERTQPDDTGERDGEIAVHWERSGEAARAAAHYAKAARGAANVHANAEACILIGRALELGCPGDRERFELLLLRSRLHARLGDPGAETADLATLEHIAERFDEDAACTVLERRIDLAFRQADHAVERDAIAQLVRRATEAHSNRWLAAAAAARARRAQSDGDFSEAIDSALEARDRYAQLGDDAACARVTAWAARACSLIPDNAGRAAQLVSDALVLADTAGDADVRLFVLRVASTVAQQSEDHERHAELNRAALVLALEVGDSDAEAACRGGLAAALLNLWHVDESLALFHECLRLSEGLGRKRVSATMGNLGALFCSVGDFPNALAWSRRAQEAALATGTRETAVAAACNAADAAWQCGDLAELEQSLRAAETLIERIPASRMAAGVSLSRGRLLRCTRLFEQSAAELCRALELTDQPQVRLEMLLDAALTHLGGGQLPSAREALNAAAEIVSARTGFYAARYHWIAACVHRAAGDGAEASAALRRAHDRYAEHRVALGAAPLRAAFEAIPAHRAICAAIDQDIWPDDDTPCVVAFPLASSSLARARRAGRGTVGTARR